MMDRFASNRLRALRRRLVANRFLASSAKLFRSRIRLAQRIIADPTMTYLQSWGFMLRHPHSDKYIFISCIPKSASTYTQRVLQLGLPDCFKFYRLPKICYHLTGKGLFRLRFRCSILRNHMHATVWNIRCL